MNLGLEELVWAKRLLPAALLAVLWSWESWRPFFGQTQGRLRHALGNLALALGNTLLIALIFAVPTAAVAAWAERMELGLLSWLQLQSWPKWFLGFLLLDGWMYLWHRANHAVPFLWHFHRLHHSDARMDVTTATRFHPGELVLSALARLLVIPLVGLDLWLLIGYEITLVGVTQFHHADVSLGFLDRWLRWVLVTPDLHKVHHSQEAIEHDSNYSSVLSLWDRLAGTLRIRTDWQSFQFGLQEESSVAGDRRPAIGYWLLAMGYRMPKADRRSPKAERR